MDTNSNLDMLRGAFDAYLARRAQPGELLPSGFLPFDFEAISQARWSAMGGEMVAGELQEMTNILNDWNGSLRQWHLWNEVTRDFDLEKAWEVRKEFVEATIHQCLLHPSAVRDALTFVATNAFHQVRLAMREGYRDVLEGDPTLPGEPPKHLNRRAKEHRLSKLLNPWPNTNVLMEQIRRLDDAEYRHSTFDYRNRSSHAIAPRLAIGYTRFVTRSVVQATQLAKQPDGTYLQVDVPGKLMVAYGFGGTPPLDVEEARNSNLEQFCRARACFQTYRSLLAHAVESIPGNN